MKKVILENKPLIEAIFELKWKIKKPSDPHYKILIGRFYDKVIKEFPIYEELPTAIFPEDMVSYLVQHRFRKEENGWPLIQLGPGVISYNATEEYTWETFKKGIKGLLSIFLDSYPKSNELKITSLQLRYIDAIDFDYEENIFAFLKENMKITLKINEEMFTSTGVNNKPQNFDFKATFPIEKPKGTLKIRFVRGKRKNKDALIWETIVESQNNQIPKKNKLLAWGEQAHDLTHKWFFKTIEGELKKRFE